LISTLRGTRDARRRETSDSGETADRGVVSGLHKGAKEVALKGAALLNRPRAQANLRRLLETTAGPYRIAVGTGSHPLEGWINTDIGWRAQYYLDLLQPWLFPPGSVSRVFSDNVIEHFSLASAPKLLGHMFKAVAPGGRVRLATPDVEGTARIYLDDPDAALAHLERNRRHGYPGTYPVEILKTMFCESHHDSGFLYDFAALSSELVKAGFSDVCRCEIGTSDDPQFVGLEKRTGPTDLLTQLAVEAIKPE